MSGENMVESLLKETNVAFTENGMRAYKTTNSALLDLFGSIGAIRGRSKEEIIDLFTKAYSEDPLIALKILFYARDIRNGLGERRTFRIIINYMAEFHTDVMALNLGLIAEAGRWDDLYTFVDTKLEAKAFELMKQTFLNDLDKAKNNLPCTLLAKWLKSADGVSVESMRLGKKTAKAFGLSYKEYRKSLSFLRKHIKVVETIMSENKWNDINYSTVPSNAMCKYRNAFMEHSPALFEQYLQEVKSGKSVIHSSTLYPYNILENGKLSNKYHNYKETFVLRHWDDTLQAQWDNLPNYIDEENNILVMADTSGSMTGRPVATSIGLAIYFAERNKGCWHNKFMTFSSRPQFVDLKGTLLNEKVSCVESINDNTDIFGAFQLILNTAKKNNLSNEDLPKAIIIISDMEFDYIGVDKEYNTLIDACQAEFEEAGYTLPRIVFWNVEDRHDIFHLTSQFHNVSLVSGQSMTIFSTLLKFLDKDPYQLMLDTLNKPLYNRIIVK